jgi:hypothetical protein
MTMHEVMAEAIFRSNQALAEMLHVASAFSNLKDQRPPTIYMYAGQLSLTGKEKDSATCTLDQIVGSAREEVLSFRNYFVCILGLLKLCSH